MRRLLLLLVLGCGQAKPAPKPPAEVALKAPEELGPDDDATTIEVLDPGTEPRHALRFHPEVGATAHVIATSGFQLEVETGGHKAPFTRFPMTVVTFTNRTLAVREREVDLGIHVDDATLVGDDQGPIAQSIDKELDQVRGKAGRAVVNDRGVVTEQHGLVVASEGTAQIGGTVSEIMVYAGHQVVVPEAPVGVGARWRTRQAQSRNGMTLTETEEYQLTAIDGDRGHVTFRVTHDAARQRFVAPGLPAYVRIEVAGYHGEGEGSADIDLSSPAPVAMDWKMKAGMNMKIVATGVTQEMNMSMDINVGLKRATP